MKTALVTLALILLALPGQAATAPAGPSSPAVATVELALTGHFQVRVGGSIDSAAKIYKTERGVPHFLLQSPALGQPWVIAAGDRKASRLAPKAVTSKEDDAVVVDLSASEGAMPITIQGRNVVFESDQGPVALEPREPILGERSPEHLLEAMPEYRRVASAFQPAKGQMRLLETLEQATDVEVFFGTWCGHCEKLVPRVMRLAQLVANPKLRFHFHGLPGRMSEDPTARQYEVNAVPSMVVRQGDRIIARLEGADLAAPEQSLTAALFGGAS